MKKTFLLSFMALSMMISASFAQTAPKKGFTVSISEKSINLAPGESQTIDVTINRSKAYKKAKIKLSLGSSLPEGLTVAFENGTDPLNERKMILTADNNTTIPSKTLILKAKSTRVSKGVMFKLNDEDAVISTN
ncbi:MAG: hypothetical protein ACJA2S_002836 [Cyclobacteriaceae bacterium]|jgi:hypothetical protein